MTLEEINRYTILRATVGSHALGLNIDTSDEDLMGVCIEPMAKAVGLHTFDQYVEQRKPTGDINNPYTGQDITVYSLKKFLRLCLTGNPNVIGLLFTPPTFQVAPAGQLRELAPQIVSRRAGSAFLGYLTAQKQRLLGERGNGGHGSPRNELVEKFGYDTKYAMHMLRLGIQGIELLETGSMSFPLQQYERALLQGVRHGEETLQRVLTWVGELEERLKDLRDTSPLQANPDEAAIEKWMLEAYFRTWSARDFNTRYVPNDLGFDVVTEAR